MTDKHDPDSVYDDIAGWLRRFANHHSDSVLIGGDLLIEAADEIDHLRLTVDRLQRAIDRFIDYDDTVGGPCDCGETLCIEVEALRQVVGRGASSVPYDMDREIEESDREYRLTVDAIREAFKSQGYLSIRDRGPDSPVTGNPDL